LSTSKPTFDAEKLRSPNARRKSVYRVRRYYDTVELKGREERKEEKRKRTAFHKLDIYEESIGLITMTKEKERKRTTL